MQKGRPTSSRENTVPTRLATWLSWALAKKGQSLGRDSLLV